MLTRENVVHAKKKEGAEIKIRYDEKKKFLCKLQVVIICIVWIVVLIFFSLWITVFILGPLRMLASVSWEAPRGILPMNAIKIISFYSGFLEIKCVSLDNNIGHACSPRRCRWTSNRFFVAAPGLLLQNWSDLIPVRFIPIHGPFPWTGSTFSIRPVPRRCRGVQKVDAV